MKHPFLISLLLVLSLLSCDKNKDTPEEPEVVAPPPTTNPPPVAEFKCEDLPPPPAPFGWTDTIVDPNKDVNAFLFNPANFNEVFVVVNGDAFGTNKLLVYNLLTQQSKHLGDLSSYLPSVNANGWVVFSDKNNTIILVKSNGDSLKVLTQTQRAHDPKWDHTGKFIYFYQEPFTGPAKLLKISTNGSVAYDTDIELPHTAISKKGNRFIYMKTQGSTCKLVLRELSPSETERVLVSGPTYIKPNEFNYANLCIDNNDENFYWSNYLGIFRCNLTSLKVDTVFKNCQNSIYLNPIIPIGANEMTYSHHTIKPINSLRLLHTYKPMELNLGTSQTNEIKIFN